MRCVSLASHSTAGAPVEVFEREGARPVIELAQLLRAAGKTDVAQERGRLFAEEQREIGGW
jgi:hypothetical protein